MPAVRAREADEYLGRHLDESIGGVIHVHSREMWQRLLDRVPTSSRDVPYGTREMAEEIERLWNESDLRREKILAMGGHEEGVITFGEGLDVAGTILDRFYRRNVE